MFYTISYIEMPYVKKILKKQHCNLCNRDYVDLDIHTLKNNRHKRLLIEKYKEFYIKEFSNLKIVL